MADDKRGTELIPRRRFGMRDLWRVGLWGIAATAAVALTVYAVQTDAGEQRLVLAVAQLRGAVPSSTQIAQNNEAETRRLAAAVRTLGADRDRLQTRLAAIEHNVEDLTGSITRATESAAAAPAAIPQPPPVIAPPESATIANVPVPRRSPLGPPSPATPADSSPQVEFGIDLGGSVSIEGLRSLWASAKSKHGALLEGLRPIITVRESARPGGVELRLVAGPLLNASLAARLCTAFANAGAVCQPAVFDGQRLALR